MIIPIFSNIIVMTFYTALNIGIIIVSPGIPCSLPFYTTIAFKHENDRLSIVARYQ